MPTPHPPVFFVRVATTGLISSRVKKSAKERNGFIEKKEVTGSLFVNSCEVSEEAAKKGLSSAKLELEGKWDGRLGARRGEL